VPAPPFLVLALVALVLALQLGAGELRARRSRRAARTAASPSERRSAPRFDPGTERRAERRARALLKSVVNRDEWEMYRDLGFIRVVGRGPAARRRPRPVASPSRREGHPAADPSACLPGDGGFSYLIYPHKPIVAYLPTSNSLLSEYCVEFPDRSERLHGPKLPDSDDVLAKWMMITADEERLIRGANMHLPGRQVDPQQVRRDLWRLAEWERARSAASGDRRHPTPQPHGRRGAGPSPGALLPPGRPMAWWPGT
jgi:hypothetical protein